MQHLTINLYLELKLFYNDIGKNSENFKLLR